MQGPRRRTATRGGTRTAVEIVLIRHAQPDWEPYERAVDDPELTRLGRQQAACCAAALTGERFDAFYASPLLRARATTEPIAESVGLKPTFQPWLREIQLPSLEGQTSEQVQAYFAKARARELAHWWDGLPGGESFRHFHERIASGIESLLSDHHRVEIHDEGGTRMWQLPREGPRLLVVAHEGTNAALLSHLLGLDPVPWAWMRFSTAWGGISRLRSLHFPSGAVWALDFFNRTEHLRDLDSGIGGNSR